MKYLLSAILSVFCCCFTEAYEIDGIVITVSYNAKGYRCIEMPPYEDVQILTISNGKSAYYSYKETVFNRFCDSLRTLNPNIDLASLQAENKLPDSGQRYAIYKNFPEEGMLTYTDKIGIGFYLYEEKLPDLEWQLEQEDTTVIGYSCQKASVVFCGRTWTAWYATSLPFDDGPWKLRGLPGLILKAEDTEGLFCFEACAIETSNTDTSIKFPSQNYEKCTRAGFQTALVDYWQDQTAFLFKQLGMEPPREKPEEQRVFTPCFLDPL